MKILDKFSLRDCVSIVTGGERGIGKAIAIGLAQTGSNIVIAGLDRANVNETKSLIEAEGVRCDFIETDITSEEQVARMVQQVLEQYGRIDVLINNAGVNRSAAAEEMSLEDWNFVININLTGQFIVSKHVAQAMLPKGKGSIVNIASMSGMIVNNPQTQCSYNSSKAGVIMLTKSMACEWAKRGIRVNAIAPGYMRTPLTAHRFEDPDSPIVKQWLSMLPMGRVGYPEELVGLAVYLASDASSYTTGSIIPVDGGYTSW